jgi:flagellar hook-associated protein 1 FlgK
MSDLLSLGLSGLSAYRSALAAVGENVANAETPGYARRSVRLAQVTSGGTADPVYRDNMNFNGVSAASVTRAWDMFRAAEARHSAAGAGRGQVREQWLGSIETALDDGAAGIGSRLTSFFNAGDALAAAPGDTLNRSRMLMALDDMCRGLPHHRRRLAASRRIAEAPPALDVTSSTTPGRARRHQPHSPHRRAGGTGRASLEDQRDRLIDSSAADIGVNVTIARQRHRHAAHRRRAQHLVAAARWPLHRSRGPDGG